MTHFTYWCEDFSFRTNPKKNFLSVQVSEIFDLNGKLRKEKNSFLLSASFS